jgi:hypothetical protein
MKLLSRLVITLAICLMAIPMMPTTVQADITTMSLRPTNKGNVGDEIYIAGASDDDNRYYVYYQAADDEWVQVLDYRDIDFEEELEGDYTYRTDTFEITESCSGKHKVVIVDKDLGDEADDDDIDEYEMTSSNFTVFPRIEITKPTNAKGPMGTEVEVRGTGFGEEEDDIVILFDGYVESGEEFEADEYGTWEGTFLVPAASKGDHEVSAAGEDTGEEDVTAVSFEVTPGISISPTEGYVGDTVTVKGSGFEEGEEDIEVTYDGDVVIEGIKAGEDGCWEKTFEVPQSARGEHKIDASGKSTRARDIDDKSFTAKPKVIIEPTEGHVGTSLTVSASGLPKDASVTVTYDGAEIGSATADADGVLPDITFEATHIQSEHTVDHPVIITYDTTTIIENFVMESDAPPCPTLTSPASGCRIGFIGKQTPALDWSEVTDDSGVSYNLQIANSADFAQVLISRTGLTETSYTLTGAEALDYGTYYWRVMAIDGALNDSGWTGAYSFKSGLLPLWAFIVSVAAIVALIGFLVFFFIRRRGEFYD